jgi:hypothetical protein
LLLYVCQPAVEHLDKACEPRAIRDATPPALSINSIPMADGVGGWLLLLCRLLVVFHPLSLAVTAVGALGALPLRGAAVGSILIARLVVVGFGMAAGRALQTLQPGAVALAKAALLASAAVDVFVYTTPYFPNNRPPGDTIYYVAATIAYHGAWLIYLARSKRVRATYAAT